MDHLYTTMRRHQHRALQCSRAATLNWIKSSVWCMVVLEFNEIFCFCFPSFFCYFSFSFSLFYSIIFPLVFCCIIFIFLMSLELPTIWQCLLWGGMFGILFSLCFGILMMWNSNQNACLRIYIYTHTYTIV